MPTKVKKPDKATISLVMSEMGKKGGEERGKRIRAGQLPVSGAAVPKPTKCARCGVEQPSARAAWVHCRKSRGTKTESTK